MEKKNYDMDALFHPKVEMGKSDSSSAVEYSPTADKGQSGVYKSVIRFVAWWQDPQHSILEKWVCWLVDPVTSRGRFIDCPSSIGKPSPLQDMYRKLKKSESVQDQKKADNFSRRHTFTAIVQVIKDEQNKDAEGKLMIWKFGKKVYEKIEAEKKPVLGEPHEPFDLLDGKAFALVITKQSGFNNYDQSRFLDKRVPLLIPDKETGKPLPINAKTPRELVFNFLKENSPELNKYGYKEWDSETHDYVNQVIVAVTGQTPSTAYADIKNAPKTAGSPSKPQQPQVKGATGITSSEISLDELSGGGSSGIDGLELPDITGSSSDFGLGGDLDEALNSI